MWQVLTNLKFWQSKNVNTHNKFKIDDFPVIHCFFTMSYI